MRLFVAVELPREVHEVLARGLSELKGDLPPARWVRANALHITLKFLGEQSESMLDDIDRCAPSALEGFVAVSIRLEGGGFFPHERRPRVAWIGGQAPGLDKWAGVVEECAASFGVPREPRRFSLHLTLARLERPWGARAVEDFMVRVGKWRVPEFEARELVLFKSDLRPSGPEYTALRRWRVGGE